MLISGPISRPSEFPHGAILPVVHSVFLYNICAAISPEQSHTCLSNLFAQRGSLVILGFPCKEGRPANVQS